MCSPVSRLVRALDNPQWLVGTYVTTGSAQPETPLLSEIVAEEEASSNSTAKAQAADNGPMLGTQLAEHKA